MRIPRFWAKATGSAENPHGEEFRLELWGWSSQSLAEALELARRRLAEMTARITRGESPHTYPYGERPLREEIIRTLGEPGAEGEAVVTRNRYGALVLNTARVPFIDVDAPEPPPVWGGLLWFLRRRRVEKPDVVLERVREACRRHARHSFRIYRTKAGYRVLATDLLLDPTASRTQELMASFDADPQFVRLCGVQQGFRARLTPKPWRCGCALPPGQHPREDATTRERFAAWLRDYDARSAGFATCRYLETIGSERVAAAARGVVDEHDRTTRAAAALPLA